MRVAQFVIGPAGSGKSTYTQKMAEHLTDIRRRVVIVNLDPAAENFPYESDVDIRELISTPDVMEEDYALGPNGALLFCMQFLAKHLEWLSEKIEDADYAILDCPGQIELYTHLPEFHTILEELTKLGFCVCVMYIIDAHLMLEADRYIGSVLWAMSTMVHFEVPHLNIVTKIDMLTPYLKMRLDELLEQTGEEIISNSKMKISENFMKLNRELAKIIDHYSVVSFYSLDYDEDSCLEDLLCIVDEATQFGEDQEVQDMVKILNLQLGVRTIVKFIFYEKNCSDDFISSRLKTDL